MKHPFYIFLVMIQIFSFIQESNSQTYISGGDVSGVWTANNSPYIITQDVTVPKESSLIIEEGTDIFFDGYVGISVSGSFEAKGTSNNPINFVPLDTSGINNYNNVGRWKGIYIYQTDLNSTISINYSLIKHTCSYFVGFKRTGAITLTEVTSAEIKNCVIKNHIEDTLNHSNSDNYKGAINGHFASNVTIKKNLISDNLRSSGIYLNNCHHFFIEDNEISNNSSYRGAGINAFSMNNIIIKNNFIHHNTSKATYIDAGCGGGIYLGPFSNNNQVINNKIINNSAFDAGGGLYLLESTEDIITGNLISNNQTISQSCGAADGGGGVYIRRCDHQLIQNNIIVNNYATITAGGVVLYEYKNDGENLIFSNNIVANNESLCNAGGGGISIFGSSFQFYNNIISLLTIETCSMNLVTSAFTSYTIIPYGEIIYLII